MRFYSCSGIVLVLRSKQHFLNAWRLNSDRYGYNTKTMLSEATRFICLGKAYGNYTVFTRQTLSRNSSKTGLNHLFMNWTDPGS